MPSHPSAKSIINRISEAIVAIDAGCMAFIATKHVTADIDELGLVDAEDYWDAIFEFLHEIQTAGPANCYAGGRPPKRCYEPGFKGLELFAYAWDSPSAGKRFYLKFAMKDGHYYHLDCHEERP